MIVHLLIEKVEDRMRIKELRRRKYMCHLDNHYITIKGSNTLFSLYVQTNVSNQLQTLLFHTQSIKGLNTLLSLYVQTDVSNQLQTHCFKQLFHTHSPVSNMHRLSNNDDQPELWSQLHRLYDHPQPGQQRSQQVSNSTGGCARTLPLFKRPSENY